jgi:hypothetical protein
MTPEQAEMINNQVRALETKGLEGLRLEWRRRYGKPPKLRSVRLLGHMLAWKIQADAFGGLDADTRRRLRSTGKALRPPVSVSPGTTLTREWKGVAQTVTMTSTGCIWEGQTYTSLSAVARAITGVRWNGPRFFGLNSKDAQGVRTDG